MLARLFLTCEDTMPRDQRVPIICPKCRQETKQSFRWLKKQNLFDCPFCGEDLTAIADQIIKALERAEKDVANDLAKLRRGDSMADK
jgi:predicted RNA-binding Zn-ribbon protein involved in translation (DUF1610 family)